jgi:hypothetical protein
MNISNITLNNLSNNTSQNFSSGDLLNKSVISQNTILSHLTNNFSSILVITVTIPAGAVNFLNGKLKTGASADVEEAKIIHKSIAAIGTWTIGNLAFYIYILIFNPSFPSYDQAVIYYSISGLFLVVASFCLSLRESIVISYRYTCDDLMDFYAKFLQLKYDIISKFQLMKKSILKFVKKIRDGLLILYNKL